MVVWRYALLPLVCLLLALTHSLVGLTNLVLAVWRVEDGLWNRVRDSEDHGNVALYAPGLFPMVLVNELVKYWMEAKPEREETRSSGSSV